MKKNFTYLLIFGLLSGILSGCGGKMSQTSARDSQSVSGPVKRR